MIIVSKYELIEKTFPGISSIIFFVKSLEPFICPCCQSNGRKVIGSRPRTVIEAGEDTRVVILRIRRLQCKTCNKIHHELPDKVVPYKRHEAKSIEEGLGDDPMLNLPIEDVTIRRWRAWFDKLTCHLLGVLASVLFKSTRKTETIPFMRTARERLQSYVGDAPGWLARVVHTVVKTNCWIHTRSAFSAGLG